MFTIGETVFYGAHGVCIIDDIQEQTFRGKTKQYYVLHSLHNPSLKLFYPVGKEQSKLMPVASQQKAESILSIFNNVPSEWIERPQERAQTYHRILESGNIGDIAQMLNTILRKKLNWKPPRKNYLHRMHKC